VCSTRGWSLSSEISPDCVRDRITIEAQLICVAESVMHLVFVRTKSNVWLLLTKLLGDRRTLTFCAIRLLSVSRSAWRLRRKW
jgi:hypothetical protein